MSKKTVRFDGDGIGDLPDDKPVVYKILDEKGENVYTGSAKRSRVRDRLAEHLPGGCDSVRGAKVQIEQMPSIEEAKAKEGRVIARTRPVKNKRGK